MSELISGKEALDALKNGKEVEYLEDDGKWHIINKETIVISALLDCKLRLKPCTITINNNDVPCCYSIGINRMEGKIEIDFKNTDDADIAYKVLKGAFGF